MLILEFKWDTKHADKYFEDLKKHLNNLRPELREIANFTNFRTQEHFRTAQGPAGSWKPRISHKFNHPLLIKSGKMLKSVTTNYKIDRDSITWSSMLPYDKTHQFGFMGRNIVARPYIWLGKLDLDYVEQIVIKGLLK